MAIEVEAVFLDINKDEFRARLRAAGAEMVQPEILMKREVFDIDKHSFVRVRDEGNKITMSYKHAERLDITGMEEICLKIDSYEQGIEFAKAIGLKSKAYQETLREEWELDGVEITIDTWPWIPTYVEIESDAPERVEAVAAKLGLSMEDAHYGSACEMYKVYYDITSDDINYMPEIKFTKVPELLEKNRRQL